MAPETLRVRFSPAPSGSLHVGSARTALFNWLFARRHAGTFALRIEDTDVRRSRPEWVAGIQDTLHWLGLDWDEGPVLQSARRDAYLAAADRLLAEGLAYECYCTEEEVRARNEAARAAGHPPGYDGHCRDLTEQRRVALAAEGRSPSIRFRTPDDGVSSFDDLIRGRVSVEWANIADFVVVRSDGTPLFFLANAVDDVEMGISHVIRGEDLLDTTHRVLALRQALGAQASPAYAHLPLIVGADRAKLSKRHGAVALEELRERGYVPEALVNYLALLGWAPEDGREVMDISELVRAFDLAHVTHAAAAFDPQKLDWMNGEWIRRLDLDELAGRVLERMPRGVERGTVRAVAGIARERVVTLNDVVEQAGFLFTPDDELEIAPESWDQLARTDRVGEIIDATVSHLASCEWTVEAVDLRPVLKGLGVKIRPSMPALYAALEGRHTGLPLFESIHLLGRERALARLRAARARLDRS